MVFRGYIMVVTWFSDGQSWYNIVVYIDIDMVNHVSTLFSTASLNKIFWKIAHFVKKVLLNQIGIRYVFSFLNAV